MKEISKVKAYKKKSIHSILLERHILKHIHHNFITNLYFSFQDQDNLYFIFDYFSGGDLRFYINKNTQFNENQIKFFVSNIILSLKYLHRINILHRDLKPDNLVFDEKGYLNLVDFGISKKIKKNKQIQERSGTPGYISPEVILKKNQTFASDFFPIGIIIYELIFLKKPFSGKSQQEIAENILHKNIKLKKKHLPKMFINSTTAEELVDFTNKLLRRKAEERLGFKGIQELIEHPWLKGTNWNTMEDKLFNEEDIPFIPCPGDNFDYLKVNKKIKFNEENYNSCLKKINSGTLFNNFYFNSFSIKKRKVLSHNNLSLKGLTDQNDNSPKVIHCETIMNNNLQNDKKYTNDTVNESNESNEFVLSGDINDEDELIIKRNIEKEGINAQK